MNVLRASDGKLNSLPRAQVSSRMVCAAISPANLSMPLRPLALRFFFAVSSPRRWVRSLAISRYSSASSASVIPLPSSSIMIGS
jgi:hypothetical protein